MLVGGVRDAVAMRATWVKVTPSRDFCGMTEEEFADLLIALAPLAEQRRAERADRPDRQRAPGAGGRPKAFAFRLLVALRHTWTGLSVRRSSAGLGIHEKSVRNYRDEIEELLVTHGVIAAGADEPIRNLPDLVAHLRRVAESEDGYVVIDGTHVPRYRPGGSWEAQRAAYSSKSHDHVVKGTVVCDPDGNPIWFEANPNGEGRTHDLAMLRSGALLGVLALAGVTVLGDLGYLGLDSHTSGDVYIPVRRARGHKHLSRDDRLYNHALAVARIRVEHSIARLKRWGAMREHRRGPSAFDRTARAVTILNSFR